MRKVAKIPSGVFVIGLLFAILVYLLAWSSLFTVSSITISGSPTSDTHKSIEQLSGITLGQKLARVEPRAIAHRISTLTWIRDVNISRNWIDGDVEIAVTPRRPTAYFNGATIDASGTVFTLPGFSGSDLPRVAASNTDRGLVAISLFQGLPKSFTEKVISLHALSDSNFAIRINQGSREIKVIWGKNEKSDLKIEVIEALLALKENQKVRQIDVSAPHAPIVK